MKKYLQIIAVLGVFGIIVLLRQHGSEAQPIIGSPSAGSAGSDSKSSEQSSPPPTTLRTGQTGSPTTGSSSGKYKDGAYTGATEDAFYGNVQVQVIISNGKITDVQFLQNPKDNPTSRQINSQAMPLLRQEALTAQSSQVDIISGASQTSAAFQQSLSSALQQAS